MVRGVEDEDPFSIYGWLGSSDMGVEMLSELWTHAFERSRLRYAQAAHGPEYAYPAWGDMITRAIGSGVLPTPGISSGTLSSHSSSCAASVGPEDEYHEPAW
jgi:hypothetical protein